MLMSSTFVSDCSALKHMLEITEDPTITGPTTEASTTKDPTTQDLTTQDPTTEDPTPHAIPKCTSEPGVMYKDGEEVLSPDLYMFSDTLSVKECAALCDGSPGCQFWAFDGWAKCELTSTAPIKTSQELRMLSSVTLYCYVTKIVINLEMLSVSQMSPVTRIAL